jgi:hypothetical protein
VAVLPLAVVVCLVAVAAGLLNAGSGQPATPRAVAASVSLASPGRTLPSGFLGLSTEYWAIEQYAGSDPSAPDPVFEQLLRNLSPGQSLRLRIGGDSADRTWWPVAGMTRPPGIAYALDDKWLSVTRALSADLGARLILGLNLEADSAQLASSEAGALISGLDPVPIEAFELGNEPSLYSIFPWYRTPSGKQITGRRPGYDFAAYLRDFSAVAGQLPAHPLAAPATGGPGWLPELGRLLDSQPRVRIAAVHRYPLQLCLTPQSSPRYPTVAHLLSPAASAGLAAQFAGAVAAAHSRHRPLLIDELNTVSCEPDRRVSQSFASALWALDTLFAFAQTGADGVQIHTFPGAGYELFTVRHGAHGSSARVSPEYYGLLMFEAAAPPGARLVPVSPVAGLRTWATLGRDRRLRVLLINPDPSRDRAVSLAIPSASATGSLERLLAPSLEATGGVTLAGRSFGATSTSGVLHGSLRVEQVVPAGGRYPITVPAASAALLVVSLTANG